jgi:phospholipase C
VSGDLTGTFDFAEPNARPPKLPGTDAFKPTNLNRVADQVPVPPTQQQVPGQEKGVRRARALPYTVFADGTPTSTGFRIDFSNQGDVAVVFQARTGDGAAPKTYTLDRSTKLSDVWDSTQGYDVEVHGPNGFFRGFRAGASSSGLAVRTRYQKQPWAVSLMLANPSGSDLQVAVYDTYGDRTTKLVVPAHSSQTKTWPLERHYGWYDLTVQIQGDPTALSRVAGHVENGRTSISDPLMGGLLAPGATRDKLERSTAPA